MHELTVGTVSWCGTGYHKMEQFSATGPKETIFLRINSRTKPVTYDSAHCDVHKVNIKYRFDCKNIDIPIECISVGFLRLPKGDFFTAGIPKGQGQYIMGTTFNAVTSESGLTYNLTVEAADFDFKAKSNDGFLWGTLKTDKNSHLPAGDYIDAAAPTLASVGISVLKYNLTMDKTYGGATHDINVSMGLNAEGSINLAQTKALYNLKAPDGSTMKFVPSKGFLAHYELTECCLAARGKPCFCDRAQKKRPLLPVNRKVARANHLAAVERMLKKAKGANAPEPGEISES